MELFEYVRAGAWPTVAGYGLFGVVIVQLLLTTVAPFVRSDPAFGAWILLASASMGVGFPVPFALTIDFVPARDRGYVAAAATALTYFLANALPLEWRVETFAAIMVVAMLPGAAVVGALAQLALVLTGIGAVLLSYFGLEAFEAAELPG